MKHKLLLLTLLTITFGLAKPKEKAVSMPSIGLLMHGEFIGYNIIDFEFSVKNTGDETLTNIQISPITSSGDISFDFSSIPDLAPGEEITGLHGYKYGQCFDMTQTYISATTLNNVQVTDLSADPYIGGSYYVDNNSVTTYYTVVNAYQEGTYQDLNNNSIVDVGDAINYTYTVNSADYLSNVAITDNNATITSINYWNNGQVSAIGIHYLTQAEINYGYVYNTATITFQDNCNYDHSNQFIDASTCYNCPNPNVNYVVTALTSAVANKISGNVKFNNNNDNCNTGISFPYRRVDTTDGTYNYATYANANGDYYFIIPNISDLYTTTTLTNLSNNFTSNPASIVIPTTNNTGTSIDYNNNNFCISATTNYTDLGVSMYEINHAVAGNFANYMIYFSNTGTTNINGSIQLTYDNGKLVFNNASPTVTNNSSNTLTWNYINLVPFESRVIFISFQIMTPPTVNTNDILTFSVVANPIAGDNNTANNTFTFNQTVRSSFDPNDKTVIEGAYINTSQASDYLNYVTRFQNTGTANATTVVIKETLDPKLDWNTFEPIASSHASNIQIKDGNDLTYTFSNIDLPYQSANEPASHGWIAYRIKPKSNFTIGDIASSNSNIYFDYNPPITTNTVTTEMVALSTTDFNNTNFALYPNPASNYFSIKTNTEASYQITDINGKILDSNKVENQMPINISNFQKGFYFVTIKSERETTTYKLIKN